MHYSNRSLKSVSSGFSLVELLVVVLILSSILGSGFLLLASGQATWFTTDVQIRLHENLRLVLERVTMELRQSEVGQGQIFNGTGPNNSDIVRFSIPIVCEAGNLLIDNNGDVAFWGAPLNWGCTDSTCMDADNDCLTVDYSSVEYALNNSNQLVRRVLDSASSQIKEDVFANNISDFQVTLNGNIINLVISAQLVTDNNRTLLAQSTTDVFLRN